MVTVEQHETIRRKFYLEHKSVRKIAAEMGLSRQTVSKAVTSSEAPTYTLTKERPAPQLGAYKTRLEELLMENRRLPKKQRRTTRKMYLVLRGEGYNGSESSVQGYAVKWRKDNRAPKVFLPLEFEAGQDGQVDWGEAQAVIGGVAQTVQIFVMRLNYSRRVFVMAFPAQKQECFFEGHVQAFAFFGGVPARLSYDNLSTAVKVLTEGRIREENRAFIAFRSYYLFESHFCTPGQGHEKGGVEHSVGFSRRNFMAPPPQVASFAELNAYLLAECRREDERTVQGQPKTIGAMWAEERPLLRPLPLRHFECCVQREVTLNGYSQVTFETNRYSIPVEKARRQLSLKAYPFKVEIRSGTELIATHPRCYEREQDIFNPLHYLALLEQRPGAFEYAKPLKEWRREWSPAYHRLLERLKQSRPDGGGIREFVQVLKLHQTYSSELVEQAVGLALSYGCAHLDGVKQCLHQLQQPQLSLPLLDLSDKPHLAEIGQQPLDLGCYEQLLEKRG